MNFQIFEAEARTILSPVSGFLREAGFTHSLTPSRNCTFGCTYCYVPTMRVQAGLKPADWQHWGQWTTFKRNAPELLAKELRPHQTIYCSPLTDPYQPAETTERLMPRILQAIIDSPPATFVIQTRGPAILEDLPSSRTLSTRTNLRISFSITTNREDVRQIFEPHCAPVEQRWQTLEALRAAGIQVTATLAPLLPCDPDALLDRALAATDGPVVADPLHVREVKRSGATTRDPAHAICRKYHWTEWLDPAFQRNLLHHLRNRAAQNDREFQWGPAGFALLLTAKDALR